MALHDKFIAFHTHKGWVHYAVLFVFIIVYACFLIPFVAHDGLSTFANDSAYYLLMARYLSPWHEPSPAITAAWPPMQDFPPLFPFILAISDAAYSYTLAHIVAAVFLLLSIPLIFVFGRSMFTSPWQSVLVVLIFCLSPSTWLNTMGILSENLYLFLSLIILIFFNQADLSKKINLFVFGLLLVLLILTRTIGVAMLAAFIIICIIKWRQQEIDRHYFVIPVLLSLACITLFQVHSPTIPTQYVDQVDSLLGAKTEDMQVTWELKEQLAAFYNGWLVGFMYYWTDQTILSQPILMLAGLFSLCGLALRIKQVKIDAIYILFYLTILLLWPHPGQFLRFLYPVLCILIMYAFYALYSFADKINCMRTDTVVSVSMLVVLMTILPTLSYAWHRYQTGKAAGHHRIAEFYRNPDLKRANKLATLQSSIFLEMKYIREITDPNAVILYFEPAYIFLLADRSSKKISFIKQNGEFHLQRPPDADYIYLTKLHPRRIRDDVNGLHIYKYIRDWTSLLWSTHSAEENEHLSSFFAITQ